MRADNTGVAVAATITEANDEFLREAADHIRSRMSRSAEDIVAIGRKLIAVKDHVGHGNFLPWIEREFRMSEDTAARFMNVARNMATQISHGAEFPPAVLYALAAPSTPEEVRTEITERTKAGETVTLAEVRSAKAKVRKTVSPIPDSDLAERRYVTNVFLDMLDLFEKDGVDPADTAAMIVAYIDRDIAGPKLSIKRLSRAIDAVHAVFRSIAIDLDTARRSAPEGRPKPAPRRVVR